MSIDEKELRDKIYQVIKEKRKPFLELCKDKNSEDYNFYIGLCNGMHYAMMLVEYFDGDN
jgi:hypothetical protein